MATPPAALAPPALPPPRHDRRYRIRVDFRPVEPSVEESEVTFEVIANSGGMVAGFVEVLQHLFRRPQAEPQPDPVVQDLLRYFVQHTGNIGANIGADLGAMRAADRMRGTAVQAPPIDIRFEPLENGNLRCSRCHEEVAAAVVLPHARTHAPPVINMHEVPAVPDEPAHPPDDGGAIPPPEGLVP